MKNFVSTIVSTTVPAKMESAFANLILPENIVKKKPALMTAMAMEDVWKEFVCVIKVGNQQTAQKDM